MNIFLILAFLFFIGSVLGWLLELFYRHRFSSTNPQHKWINPGFCVGPYVPLYGLGLCVLYLLAITEDLSWVGDSLQNKLILFVLMAVCMTILEYIAGIICLKYFKVRLWDYSGEWANIQGIVCPKFSAFWALMGAGYYFAIHEHILEALHWLSQNLAFSFVVGMFFGIFSIDLAYSTQLVVKIRRFATENDIIVRYEHLKENIRKKQEENSQKIQFMFPFYPARTLSEHLRQYHEMLLEINESNLNNIREIKEKIADKIEERLEDLDEKLDELKSDIKDDK